jgi:hypothetical protein
MAEPSPLCVDRLSKSYLRFWISTEFADVNEIFEDFDWKRFFDFLYTDIMALDFRDFIFRQILEGIRDDLGFLRNVYIGCHLPEYKIKLLAVI